MNFVIFFFMVASFIFLIDCHNKIEINCKFDMKTDHCFCSSPLNIDKRLTEVTSSIPGTKSITIKTQKVLYFPIFDNAQLERIVITRSGLIELEQENLKNYAELKDLRLTGNDLSSLDSKTFYFNTKLEFLDLSDNEITQIHFEAFTRLSQLSFLNLTNNLCISVEKSSTKDIAKVIEYSSEKCMIENFDQFDDGKSHLLLTIGLCFLAGISVLQCCFSYFCCQREKLVHETLPSLIRDRVDCDAINFEKSSNSYANLQSIPITRPVASTSATFSNYLPPKRKISNHSSADNRPETPVALFTRDPISRIAPNPPTILSLTPKVQEIPPRPFVHASQDEPSHLGHPEENPYMQMSEVSSGGDGYMIMNDFKKNHQTLYEEIKVNDQVEYENYRKPTVEYSEVTVGDGNSPHYLPMTGTLPKDEKKKTKYANLKFNN